METAMQLLIQYIDPIHSEIHSYATKLLEIERQQIVDAYYAGTEQFDNAAYIVRPKTPEDYYSEKYK